MSRTSILTSESFGLVETKGGRGLMLRPPEKGKYHLCMFGVWSRERPNEQTDQAYAELKKAIGSFPDNLAVALLDVGKHQKLVVMSRNTQNAIKSIPKLILFSERGLVVDTFPANYPKTSANIIQFVKTAVKPRARKPPSRHEEDEEDEEEEELPARRSRKKSYYEPEFGNPKISKSMIRGKTYDQEEGEEFLIPEEVTPHNKPWENTD